MPQLQSVLCVLLQKRATGCGAWRHPGQSISGLATPDGTPTSVYSHHQVDDTAPQHFIPLWCRFGMHEY